MFIHGIEHAISFWIDDENGNEIYSNFFSSLEEMNEFLAVAEKDDKYDCLDAFFSPVEMIKGVPDDAVKVVYKISPILQLLPEEIEEHYDYFEEDYKFSVEVSEAYAEDTKFKPMPDAEDYESKKVHRDDLAFICPFCFREVDDCRCNVYPYYLVQIDKLLVPAIRALNKKGYLTTACCSGHIKNNSSGKLYIAFAKEHDFGDNIPEGSLYSKSSKSIFYNWLFDLSEDELKAYQLDCIKHVTEWAENLPSLG